MKLGKAITTIGGFTLLSRVFGFIRDILTASIMGAGPIADAFFVALKLPNFFRRITAEGAFSVSFVPMFSDELERNGKEEAIKFAEETQAMMLFVVVPISILLILAMPFVIYGIAPGFVGDEVRYDLAVDLSRITFPYILMMSLVAMFGGILNSFNRFGPFAAAPVLFNICLIMALLFAAPIMETPGHAMAWGVAAAGFAQLIWMIIHSWRAGVRLRLVMPDFTPRIKKLFSLMGPGVLGAGAVQINLLIDLILASLLPAGAISYLYYADRLYQLPLSVIGIAIGTALLPMLSKTLSAGLEDSGNKLLNRSIEISMLFAIPASMALVIIPMPIINVLFERGAFTPADSLASSYALMAYAFGLPAFIIVKILSTSFFARQDTKTPVKYAIIGVVVNTIFGIALIGPLQHVGIAVATSIAAWVNMSLLAFTSVKKGYLVMPDDVQKKIVLILLASIVMGMVLLFAQVYFAPLISKTLILYKFVGLGVLILSGALTYAMLIIAMKIISYEEFRMIFKKVK